MRSGSSGNLSAAPPIFLKSLESGRIQWKTLRAFLEQDTEELGMGGKTADEVEALLAEKLDPEDVDRTRDLPTDVLTAVQSRGSLGLGNQAALGGLGLSAHRAFRVFERAASRHP